MMPKRYSRAWYLGRIEPVEPPAAEELAELEHAPTTPEADDAMLRECFGLSPLVKVQGALLLMIAAAYDEA